MLPCLVIAGMQAQKEDFRQELAIGASFGTTFSDRKSAVEGKSVSACVEIGGCRVIKKTKLLLDSYMSS